jgi:uncharacterized membrane protein HdeD (DUF308 family)
VHWSVDQTFEALVLLFGVFALVRGSIWLSFSLLAAGAHDRWWPLVVNGIIGLAVGVLCFAETQVMAVALVSLVGVWAVLTGGLEIVAAVRFRQYIPNELLLALGGLLSIVFGVLILPSPRSAPRCSLCSSGPTVFCSAPRRSGWDCG